MVVVVELNQNASPEAKQGSFTGGVSAARSSAIGYVYSRGAPYSYEDRVLHAPPRH